MKTKPQLWSADEIALLEELYPTRMTRREIADRIGRSEASISCAAYTFGLTRPARLKKLKPVRPPRKERHEPPDVVWIAAATEAAREGRLSPGKVLSGDKQPKYCEARWRAWKSVLAIDPVYSVGGLARVSGWNHTSILAGLKRLKEIDASRTQERVELLTGLWIK